MRSKLIARIYRLRCQLELIFKQFKQNFPLKYFLGDNENAIKIQIYCALIINLLMTVILKTSNANGCIPAWLVPARVILKEFTF